MNTNNLMRLAQETRKKLLEQVGSRLSFVLNADTLLLREKTEQIKQLREELNRTPKEQIIEKVAYTWFNRLMALRFMDANDYQPLGLRIITPKDGFTIPELLDEAKKGNIPNELKINRKRVFDLLDNRILSSNPQNEAYKELLIAACNHLNSVLPFLFERINDYTEILLPEDLTSDFSVVTDIRNGMLKEDCKNVEIIGWLYQFYISEEKDRLINAKKKYKSFEIPYVTQLFTPKWIVKYLVNNTLGQFWNEARPRTNIVQNLEFYIRPENVKQIQNRQIQSPEEITFLDPCVGSAHILCYAFEILYKIYEEEGYSNSDIAELIITKNLFGIDIDDRAAQLAGFALMMKGRQYDHRFLKKGVNPNIIALQDFDNYPKFKKSKIYGSLINLSQKEADEISIDNDSLFSQRQNLLKKQASYLAKTYDIVVTNPPYVNASYMEGELKGFIEAEYPKAKTDLFACFLAKYVKEVKNDGFVGFICPYVWMFLKSYSELRKFVLNTSTISSLIQLEYNAFEPAVVPICTFVLKKQIDETRNGVYIKLSEFKGVENQPSKTLEAISNPNVKWRFSVSQSLFKSIEDYPISFWASLDVYKLFKEQEKIGDSTFFKTGVTTGDNYKFTRFWFEVESRKFSHPLKFTSYDPELKWYPLNCGGAFRKWYGNDETVINWYKEGEEIKNFIDPLSKKRKSTIRNESFYFIESLSWSKITNYKLSLRYNPKGYLFDAVGLSAFTKHYSIFYIQGFLNSTVALHFSKLLNESMSVIVGDLVKFPFVYGDDNESIITSVHHCIEISKDDWDSKEISFDFNNLFLLKNKINNSLSESLDNLIQYWNTKFILLHKTEEELNRQFIKIYGLQDSLTPYVPFEDVTILQGELDRKALTKLNKKIIRDYQTNEVLNYQDISIPIIPEEVVAQFISYSVGCMFGRYSLDKDKLILTNQGETLQDYLRLIDKSLNDTTFLPDEENIIPVLEDEWFEDDIVARFHQFLKVTFGEKNFNNNLSFIEDKIGKDLRKYFLKDFYHDHIKRYKKRPIYWMFSSPKGSFNVLIYLHRYTPDTISNILNKYLRELINKQKTLKEHLSHIVEVGSSAEKTRAIRGIDAIEKTLVELREYERDILYPLAVDRISINLDDGILVNYNKFGKAIKEVNGLNDTAMKKKIRQFEWIDTTKIP